MTVESNRTHGLRRCGVALAFALAAAAPLGAQTLNVVMASRLSVLDPVLTTAHQTRN